MTILITLLTLTVLTFFLIGNFYSTMQQRAHNKNKTIEKLQKQVYAKKLKIESQENSLNQKIKEAERRLSSLKKSFEDE